MGKGRIRGRVLGRVLGRVPGQGPDSGPERDPGRPCTRPCIRPCIAASGPASGPHRCIGPCIRASHHLSVCGSITDGGGSPWRRGGRGLTGRKEWGRARGAVARADSKGAGATPFGFWCLCALFDILWDARDSAFRPPLPLPLLRPIASSATYSCPTVCLSALSSTRTSACSAVSPSSFLVVRSRGSWRVSQERGITQSPGPRHVAVATQSARGPRRVRSRALPHKHRTRRVRRVPAPPALPLYKATRTRRVRRVPAPPASPPYKPMRKAGPSPARTARASSL